MIRPMVLVLSLLNAALLSAADWPQWGGGPTRNAVSLEKGAPADFQPPVRDEDGKVLKPGCGVAWQAELGTRTVIPPVVAGGLVWVGTNAREPAGNPPARTWDGGVLMCFGESDGKLLWRHRTPRLTTTVVEDCPYAALGSAPLVEGDWLWYVNNRCEVVCLDIAPLRAGMGDPRELWKLDMRKEFGVFQHLPIMQAGLAASVAADRDRLFVVTHNGVDESHVNIPAPNAPSLVCLEKATGKVLWKDGSPGKNILQCQTSSPLVCEVGGRQQVIVGQGDGWLRSFDPATGRVLWKCDLNPKDAVYDLGGRGTRNYIVATPVLYDGRVYIPTGHNPEHGSGVGGLYCVDPTRDGDVSRELEAAPKKGRPNPNSAVVWYTPPTVPADAPRVEVGKKKRDLLRDLRDFYFGRCVATVTAHDGLVYAAEFGGLLFCFDARSGRCYWADDLKASVWGQPLWADGKVYVGTEQGEVFVYTHGKEKRQLAKVDAGDSIHPGPVFA
ncbi:MAG TPA: PQQ-binding-like beta-propeller repeat protein, partial [Gemmataceae bacterium]|nr:PQQ-binding-like beta-propeller repeat protein [Gemmataceae bacterium]